jgi:hypothetical protein
METYISISALELSVSEPLTDIKQYTSCILFTKNKKETMKITKAFEYAYLAFEILTEDLDDGHS